MQIPECIQLIERGFPKKIDKSIWADLGCGSGLFTKALASLLGQKSKIFALDKSHQIIEPIHNDSEIEFIKTDFVSEPLPLKNLDGVLMANSLHYVKDKPKFILALKQLLKANGQLVIVEYQIKKPNDWIPYPIVFDQLIKLLSESGFASFKKLGERKSIYQAEKMYACSGKLAGDF